jgi:two-component system nitrogen regulation response regulator GlnG
MKSGTVLVADDDASLRWVLEKFLSDLGFTVYQCHDGSAALDMIKKEMFSFALVDIKMPRLNGLQLLDRVKEINNYVPVIIMTAQDSMKNAIEAMKRGAYDYITKPFDLYELEVIVNRAVESKKLRDEVSSLKVRVKKNLKNEAVLIGRSAPMQKLYKTIGKVAPQDVTVLISGESGTGKELVAKVIHIHSKRVDGPFIAINSAAIPKELLESEIFGFDKGAFTGATEQKPGKLELAQGGTIFMDEIGEMPLDLQSKLLRAIQEKEFFRLGGSKPIKVDVRFIAATNQDLEAAVAEKRFRDDLFYRLNVVNIPVAPLRKRKDDIPLLAEHILKRISEETESGSKSLTKEAVEYLTEYSWPGNVRELENLLRRAFIMSPDPIIKVQDIILPVTKKIREKESLRLSLEEFFSKRLEGVASKVKKDFKGDLYAIVIKGVEKPLIELVLKKTNGNQIVASKVLGINRNTLRKKIKELKIKVKE